MVPWTETEPHELPAAFGLVVKSSFQGLVEIKTHREHIFAYREPTPLATCQVKVQWALLLPRNPELFAIQLAEASLALQAFFPSWLAVILSLLLQCPPGLLLLLLIGTELNFVYCCLAFLMLVSRAEISVWWLAQYHCRYSIDYNYFH